MAISSNFKKEVKDLGMLGEDSMGVKSEGFAKEIENKIQEAIAAIEELGDEDWTTVTEGEKWSVGVTAHHVAEALEPVSNMVKAVVAGQAVELTNVMLDEMNAKHAGECAKCTKKETIELFKKGAAAAVAVIRGLSDDQLAKSGSVLAGVPPMTAEQLITMGLLEHIAEHFESIRKTIRN
jgi:hypothetical protein